MIDKNWEIKFKEQQESESIIMPKIKTSISRFIRYL